MVQVWWNINCINCRLVGLDMERNFISLMCWQIMWRLIIHWVNCLVIFHCRLVRVVIEGLHFNRVDWLDLCNCKLIGLVMWRLLIHRLGWLDNFNRWLVISTIRLDWGCLSACTILCYL